MTTNFWGAVLSRTTAILVKWDIRSPRVKALVVSLDSRNRLASDVIVVPIASVLHEAPAQVRLTPAAHGEGGITPQ